MAIEFSSTSRPVRDQGIKILCYGPAGIGKTALTATMPGRNVLIGVERGELSLQPANQQRLFGKVVDIPIFRIKSAADLREAYDLITSPQGAAFSGVALDSLSEIAELVLAQQLAFQKDPRKAYGNMQETMAKYIRLFRDIPNKNVYMTAKQDRQENGEGQVMFGPSMPGKSLTQDVAHYFDEVFCFQVTPKDPVTGKSWRQLLTQQNSQYIAKDRSGVLNEIEEPNLAKIIAKIKQN